MILGLFQQTQNKKLASEQTFLMASRLVYEVLVTVI